MDATTTGPPTAAKSKLSLHIQKQAGDFHTVHQSTTATDADRAAARTRIAQRKRVSDRKVYRKYRVCKTGRMRRVTTRGTSRAFRSQASRRSSGRRSGSDPGDGGSEPGHPCKQRKGWS